mmetsp:Transcript_65831/g.129736  ORF Transcript_65831/g.129736 Transcript_65831/m.129736 type:complete len:122 (-) Transcript_65831:223-588(-)
MHRLMKQWKLGCPTPVLVTASANVSLKVVLPLRGLYLFGVLPFTERQRIKIALHTYVQLSTRSWSPSSLLHVWVAVAASRVPVPLAFEKCTRHSKRVTATAATRATAAPATAAQPEVSGAS